MSLILGTFERNENTMTTFNLELNNKPNRNGLYNVQIRITQNKKHKRLKTLVYVKSPYDFNAIAKNENWVRKSEPLNKKYNSILVDELKKAKESYQELKGQNQASLENIKNKIMADEVPLSFLEFAKERAKQIYNEGAYRNFKKYNCLINKLETYLATQKKKDLLFSELNTAFLVNFDDYLHTLKNVRNKDAKLHPNYIAKLFDTLKALVNHHFEINHLNPNSSPFVGFSGGKTVITQKPKLENSEIIKIEDLDLEQNSLIWHSRNLFLMAYYFAGIRAGDVLQLRWKNIKADGRLEYTMSKNNKTKSFNLHDKAIALLRLYYKDNAEPNNYIFPFLDSNAEYAKADSPDKLLTLPVDTLIKLKNTINSKNSLANKYLKKIGKLIGLEQNLTMHIARHSFAKRAAENNINNNIIKSILAHENIAVTEKYIGNFTTEEEDKAMARIFNTSNEIKEELKRMIDEMNIEEASTILENLKLKKAG